MNYIGCWAGRQRLSRSKKPVEPSDQLTRKRQHKRRLLSNPNRIKRKEEPGSATLNVTRLGIRETKMYEEWDLEEASVPPRSRLYHLKPIGVGTLYAESLTSYIVRLAEAHCVLPKILVTHEILPLLGRPSRSETSSLYSYTAWSGNVQTLNGTSEISEKCVGALEKLTGRDNLRAYSHQLKQGRVCSAKHENCCSGCGFSFRWGPYLTPRASVR